MFSALKTRGLRPIAAIALVALLGGCVYPAYPGYGYGYNGYYGGGYYGAPYYAGPTVAFGTGWGWRGGDHDWHR